MKSFTAKLISGLSLLSFSANILAVTMQSLTLPLTFTHENNPRYSIINKQPISRITVTPNYSISSNSGANQWFSTASLSLARTSDQTISQDRNDPSLNLGWTHNYDTGEFSATGLLNDQSTQVSELTDSGLISGDNTKKTRAVSINWRNSLTNRTSLTLGQRVTKASFHGLTTTGLVNYQNETSNVKVSHSLNDQTEVFSQLVYSLQKPENSDSSNTKSLNFGLTWTMSEKINTTISVGANEAKSGNSSNQSWQARIGSNYATLRTKTQLSVSRSQSPSSTGSFNESNQLALGWSYSLTERDNIGFDVTWRENLSANNTQIKLFSANYKKELSLSWNFNLSATHNMREDKLTNVSSRSIMASIIYKLPDF